MDLVDSDSSEPESSSRSGKGEKEVIEIGSSDEDEPEPKDNAVGQRAAVKSDSASLSATWSGAMDLIDSDEDEVDEMEVDEVSSERFCE